MRRIPEFLRTPLLLLVLVVGHLLFGDVVESVRLLALRGLTSPLSFVYPDPPAVAVPAGTAERIAAWRTSLLDPFGGDAHSLFPVLDHEPDRGYLIVGGGTKAGISPGARVTVADALVGVVDRVTPHLARVRLLTARDVEVPVQADYRDRVLPGNVENLVGVLRGTGEHALVARTHLPHAFREGDPIRTLPDVSGRTWPVGVVVKEGARPRVRLRGVATGAALVYVEVGSELSGPSSALFREVDLSLELPACARHRGILLSGPRAESLLPGCPVHAQGRYLGRVLRVAFGTVHAASANDPGEVISVQLLFPDRSVPAQVQGLGEGRFVVLGDQPPTGPVCMVTAGGQELVPPGLLVGVGSCHDGVVVVDRGTDFPGQCQASVFRFGGERARLREIRR